MEAASKKVNRRHVIALAAAALIVVGIWPTTYLASPRWEVWVVGPNGQPIPQINVRLVYQNYSVEGKSHEMTFRTDENGRVVFPQRRERTCIFQRLFYTLSSATAGVHASFGQHATVFAFDNSREGFAVNGESVLDWRGSPGSMESRIMAK